MTTETMREQAEISVTDQLRQYTDGLFQDVPGTNVPSFSLVRYVGGEKDHIVRFSKMTGGSTAYRIEYENKDDTLNGNRSFILDEIGAWNPSIDCAVDGSEEAESQHISRFLMDCLSNSTDKPLNHLGRIAL